MSKEQSAKLTHDWQPPRSWVVIIVICFNHLDFSRQVFCGWQPRQRDPRHINRRRDAEKDVVTKTTRFSIDRIHMARPHNIVRTIRLNNDDDKPYCCRRTRRVKRDSPYVNDLRELGPEWRCVDIPTDWRTRENQRIRHTRTAAFTTIRDRAVIYLFYSYGFLSRSIAKVDCERQPRLHGGPLVTATNATTRRNTNVVTSRHVTFLNPVPWVVEEQQLSNGITDRHRIEKQLVLILGTWNVFDFILLNIQSENWLSSMSFLARENVILW